MMDKTIEIRSFQDFVNQTEFLSLISDNVLFRGQDRQGNLLPNIARDQPNLNTELLEKQMLNQFFLMGSSLIPSSISALSLDLMVLAQHYGLKTRLLDWTSNPFAALWFACSSLKEGDVYIYALETDNLMEHDLYEKNPFSHPQTRVFQPRLNNPRIIAQHGWFTLHRYSKRIGKFVSLEKNTEAKKYLSEFMIPSKYKSPILDSLNRHGINEKTLYPDLSGLSEYLNWKMTRI